jgi:DNA-binding MarR family transcriptional regulator
MELTSFKQIFWDGMRRMTQEASSLFNCCAAATGLTVLQVGILMEVHRLGTVSIGTLGKNMCIAGGNISNLCKKMETMGLLSRTRSQQDERVVMVAITPKGTELLRQGMETLTSRVEEVIQEEPQENLDEMLQGIQKMNQLLQRMKSAYERNSAAEGQKEEDLE